MVDRKLLGKKAREWGYNLEERAYRLLNQITPNVHTNIKIFHSDTNKQLVEIDIIFVYKRVMYLVECKRRKTRHTKSSVYYSDGTHLFLDGRKVTAQMFGSLWRGERFIKEHRIHKAYGEPPIKRVFLLDGFLQGINEKKPYSKCNNVIITTMETFPLFLKKMRTSPYNLFPQEAK